MEWLYSGPASTVNREEYLLGKKIDKFVDPTLTEEAREKEVCLFFLCEPRSLSANRFESAH